MNPSPPSSPPLNGILVLDKPAGISSAGLLNRMKRLLPRGTKLGHAGTLDPFATGVLLALVGKATKRCEELMGSPKTYITRMKLGAITPTLDPESPEEPVPGSIPTEADVGNAIEKFRGAISQVPPVFSAIKVGGRRAYDLARKGQAPQLLPRTVQVFKLNYIYFEYPFVELEMEVGRGFYVRSLARDLGQALGSAGYLSTLRRMQVGDFHASDAVTLEQLTPESLPNFLKT